MQKAAYCEKFLKIGNLARSRATKPEPFAKKQATTTPAIPREKSITSNISNAPSPIFIAHAQRRRSASKVAPWKQNVKKSKKQIFELFPQNHRKFDLDRKFWSSLLSNFHVIVNRRVCPFQRTFNHIHTTRTTS